MGQSILPSQKAYEYFKYLRILQQLLQDAIIYKWWAF